MKAVVFQHDWIIIGPSAFGPSDRYHCLHSLFVLGCQPSLIGSSDVIPVENLILF